MTTEQRVARMVLLSKQILERQIEFMQLKDEMREQDLGKYGQTTVYKVRRTNVRAYSRRGFVAVRVNIR